MRKLVVIAASLALASAGVLAAAQDPAPKVQAAPQGQAEKDTQTRTKKKTIIVERDDEGGAPRVFSWDENGDFDAALAPGLMVPGGPRIGVTVANLDESQAKSGSGVVVTGVREDGPAAKAGVQDKDLITEFDGERVRSAAQLTRLVSETPEGRAVKMAVVREGKRVDLQVTPENDERPMAFGGGRVMPGVPFEIQPRDRQFFHHAPEHPELRTPEGGERFGWKTPGPGGDRFFYGNPGEGPHGDGTFDLFATPGRGRLGVGVQDLSGQLAEFFGTTDGVLVTSVMKDSPAAKAGLRAGDVITSVDGTPVASASELIGAVQKADDGATLKLGYVRDKKAGAGSATLAPRERPKMKKEMKPI